MISVAVRNALAATLVDDGVSILDATDGEPPLGVDLWLDAGSSAAQSSPTGEATDGSESDGLFAGRLSGEPRCSRA